MDQVAVSSNGGLTWTVITPPNSEACTDVAMSLDGGHMYYVSSGGVYYSTIYGSSFLPLPNPPASATIIACDSTGQKIYCPGNDGVDFFMYVSINAGTAFTQTANLGFTPTSIACSADGVYVYLVNDPNVHGSSDSGLTFTSVPVYGGGTLQRIVCDQTGQKIFVAATANIRISIDYGATFIKSPYPDVSSCIDIAYDSLGNRIVGLQADGTINISYDAGTTWQIQPPIIGQILTFTSGGVSISPDGTRYVSSLGALGTYIKSEGTADVAPIWTIDNTQSYFNGIFSYDNQRIVAIKYDINTQTQTVIYSSNSGMAWNEVVSFGDMLRLIASLSGETVLALMYYGGLPYLSTNYGASFSEIPLVPIGDIPSSSAVMNLSGTSMMTLANDGYVYLSTDSGATWNSPYQFVDIPSTLMRIQCSSRTMDRVYVTIYPFTGLSTTFVSTDMGTSWTSLGESPSTSDTAYIACDWSGQNLVLSANNDGVYRSTNGGLSWTHTTAPTGGNMLDIASNSTGNRIVVVDYTSNLVYVSIDAGMSWTTLCTPTASNEEYIAGFTLSPDGSRVDTGAQTFTTYIQTLGAADLPLLPGAPFFTSAIIVDSSTITIEFAVGYPGASALTAIEYARDTDNYATWTTITGLTTPLEDATSATITGLTPTSSGSYKIRSVNSAGPSAASAAATAYIVNNGEYYTKVIFSSDNQYAIARKFNDGGVDQAAVSSDGGATWTAITVPGGNSCYDVAMSLDGTIMYYTSYDSGLYKSTGHSTTFTSVSAAPLTPTSIVCNSTGQRVFLQSDNDYSIYVSDDAGDSFALGAELGVFVNSMACNESGDHIYLCHAYSVYVSTDYGATFPTISSLSGVVTSVTCDKTGKLVFASTTGLGGVSVSVNYGASFDETLYNADNQDDVIRVVCDSLGNRLTSLTQGGIIRVSYNAGTTWSALPPILGQSLTFTTGGVAISPDGTRYVSTIGTPGTYIYSEGTPDTVPYWSVISGVSYSGGSISTDNQNIVAESYDVINETYSIVYSRNEGVLWNQSNTFGSVQHLVASASGEIVLACMDDTQVPYLSTDYGETFNITSLSLVGSAYPDRAVMNSTGASIMAVASDGYVYKSIDSGDEWTTSPYQFTDGYTTIHCSSASMDRVYVSVYPNGGGNDTIYFSTNMGTSWTSLGLSPSTNGTGFMACDWSGQNVVFSAYSDGVYRSTNGGVSWTHIPFPSGTSMGYITSNSTGNRIVVVEDNNYIFYVSIDAGETWSVLSTPDTTNAYSPMIRPDGSSVIAATSTNTYFQTLGAADLPPGSATVPDAPSFTSPPTIISNTSISIDFTLGADGGSTITGIEYARAPSYDTWIPISGLTSPVTITVDSPSTGGYKIRSVNAIGNSDPSAEGFVLAIAPAAPSFTSTPTAVNTTSINIAFSLGFNGGLALMDLEYARDTDSYATWFSVGLTTPLEGQTTATITGLTAPVTGNYKIRAVNDVGPSAASAAGLVSGPVPCFLEGSKILCQVDGVEKYVAVETIRPGTLVKTSRDGFQPVKLIGSRPMVNVGGDKRDKNSLYLCTKANYPELTEDLIITGCHAILVDHITDAHRQGIINTLERVFVTDKKYRLPACVDERAAVHQATGDFTVWHFALEHADIKMNYGVYAHGLLVESSPIWHMNTKNYTLVQ